MPTAPEIIVVSIVLMHIVIAVAWTRWMERSDAD